MMVGSALYAAMMLTASAVGTAPELTRENLAQWRDTIRPTAAEVRWQEIPWRPTFWEGVVEAQRKEAPILIWAMNGHPLACT